VIVVSFIYIDMVEFSADLSKRYEGVQAVSQKVTYRLSVRAGEIPYFNGGLDVQEFSVGGNLSAAVSRALSDFRYSVSVSGDRVLVGDILIALPEDLL